MMEGFVELICLLTACLIFLLISETTTIQAQGTEGSIRLRGGINSQSGYLEIIHDGVWGRVCDTQWDHNDAHVVCKQEGYNGAKFPPDPFQESPNTGLSIVLDNVQCTGRQSALTECEKGPWGSFADGCQTVKIQCLSYLQQHIGCFADTRDRILPSYSANCNSGQIDPRCNGCDNTNNACDSSAMTVEVCVEICCTINNFVYAGLQAGDECYCGDSTANYARYSKLQDVSCNAQCSGNPQQSCGSDFIMDVYDCSSGCGIPEGLMGKPNLQTNPPVQQATLHKTGEELSFSCQAGFQLLGAEKISCQPGGPWSALVPECVELSATLPVMNPCSMPDVPQNGQYIPIEPTYQPGSIIQLFCSSGFGLEGSPTRTCQRDGTWTPADRSCKGGPKCPSPPTPSNGQLDPAKVNYDPGESVVLTCSVGYLVQGVPGVICKDDSTWNGDFPTCQMVDCGPLPNYPRTTPSTTETAYQTAVTYECIDRYQFVNGQTTHSKTCNKDGIWVGNDPVCELRECKPLPKYFKTVRATEETAVGTLVTFDCEPGYQLTATVHTPSKKCTRDDVWTGENPVCEQSGCPPLQNFENALPSTIAKDIGTSVTFTCTEGTIQLAPGNPTMNCSEGKQWTGTDPNCVEDFDCGPLQISANVVANTTLTALKTGVAFTCLTGFELENSAVKMCTQQGWVGQNPRCRNINDCESTPCLNGGQCKDGINSYTCDCFLTDYAGTRCEIYLACGQVPSFLNAIPHFEGDLSDVWATVGYSCSERYEHKGDVHPSKTCNVSLMWDGPDPNCRAVRCAPSELPTGWTSIETDFPVNNEFQFNCTKNQTIGKASKFCEIDGSWDNDTSSCEVTGLISVVWGIPVAVFIILIIILVLLILLCILCVVYKVYTREYAEYKKNEANNEQGNVPMQSVVISSPKPIGEANYGMTNDEADTGVASNGSDNQDFSMGSEANYSYHGQPYADSEYQAGTNDSGMFPSDVESEGVNGSGEPEEEEEEEEEAGPSGEQTKTNGGENKKGDGDKKDKDFVDDMLDSAKEKLDNCVIQ